MNDQAQTRQWKIPPKKEFASRRRIRVLLYLGFLFLVFCIASLRAVAASENYRQRADTADGKILILLSEGLQREKKERLLPLCGVATRNLGALSALLAQEGAVPDTVVSVTRECAEKYLAGKMTLDTAMETMNRAAQAYLPAQSSQPVSEDSFAGLNINKKEATQTAQQFLGGVTRLLKVTQLDSANGASYSFSCRNCYLEISRKSGEILYYADAFDTDDTEEIIYSPEEALLYAETFLSDKLHLHVTPSFAGTIGKIAYFKCLVSGKTATIGVSLCRGEVCYYNGR